MKGSKIQINSVTVINIQTGVVLAEVPLPVLSSSKNFKNMCFFYYLKSWKILFKSNTFDRRIIDIFFKSLCILMLISTQKLGISGGEKTFCPPVVLPKY